MDGPLTMTQLRSSFRTPIHILLPKLLQSRDAWKAKSDRRKAQLKAAQIKIRDCSASRARWRERAERLAQENRQLRDQLALVSREGVPLPSSLVDPGEKKRERLRSSRRRHAAVSIRCR